ncbi:M42 family metallopeptidase [Candidatus Acetothermia bacterium]|nr:M42 family metallopeptidase [Candidatus Acetothermia bacterium]
MKLLKKLSQGCGIPGREEEIRSLIKEDLTGHVDAIRTDRLGNIIATKQGEKTSSTASTDRCVVAIAAHMDEIGFMVSHIDKETGFLRIHPVGGFDPRTLIAQRITVHTSSKPLIGAIGTKPVHILTEEDRKKPLDIKDLFVDLGLPKEKVTELVQIGDPITLRQDFISYGDLVSGKALDDRIGIYVGLEAIKQTKENVAEIHFIGTTQEEVGLRGAKVAGFEVKPDISIALDVTLACDLPNVPAAEHITKLGAGVAIKIKDSASISHPGLVKAFRRLAEEKKIPYQMEILPRGGTDAGALQLVWKGTAAITLSIPTRYVHSVVESAHKEDITAAIDLLTAFLQIAHTVDLSL